MSHSKLCSFFQYGPFGDYLVDSLSFGHGGHHGGDPGASGYAPPPSGYAPPPSGYAPPPAPSYRPPDHGTADEVAGPQRPKRFPDLPIFRKREGLSKESSGKGASSSSGYWSGLPSDFLSSDSSSLQSNFPISSLFFDRRWIIIITFYIEKWYKNYPVLVLKSEE